VKGGIGTDTLEFIAGAAVGTVSGVGSLFTGFETLAVDTGARWTMAGANTLGNTATVKLTGTGSLAVTGSLVAPANLTVTGPGTLSASGGSVEVGNGGTALAGQIFVDSGHALLSSAALAATAVVVDSGGALTGSGSIAASLLDDGTVTVGASGSLDVTGSIDPASFGLFVLTNASLLEVAADTGPDNQISFLGASGEKLAIDAVAQFGSNIGLVNYSGPELENFSAVDAIDLKDLVFTGATIDSFTSGAGLLQLHSGATKATLFFDPDPTLASGSFHLGADSGTGTLLTHS
jgi:hypothetical protein